MEYTYQTKGTCSRQITLDIQDGILKSVSFEGGCSGNLQGISALVEGMPVEDVVKKLEGIKCGKRPTSCPDQLSCALRELGY